MWFQLENGDLVNLDKANGIGIYKDRIQDAILAEFHSTNVEKTERPLSLILVEVLSPKPKDREHIKNTMKYITTRLNVQGHTDNGNVIQHSEWKQVLEGGDLADVVHEEIIDSIYPRPTKQEEPE